VANKVPVQQSRSVEAYRFEEERPQVRVEQFKELFDDYTTGPTVEDLLGMIKEMYQAFQEDPEAARSSTMNTRRFTDHGYRQKAGGFHQFYLSEPSIREQLEHFSPPPLKRL